ncbi:hypothetical protein ACM64Y_14465 [Novispirillum sp. DQ9]|uniref:hypothetical protein n=1 Tax=Novispirillum sp. DQ9 TaxID=3398612 RepID=UPI003C7A5138
MGNYAKEEQTVNICTCNLTTVAAIAAAAVQNVVDYREYYGPIPTKQSAREERQIIAAAFAFAAVRHSGLSKAAFEAAIADAACAAKVWLLSAEQEASLPDEHDVDEYRSCSRTADTPISCGG